MRLDKFLSSQLYISRTDAKKLLRQKRITVGGVPNCKPETNIDPDRDEIRFDGERIIFKKYIYIMLNKPTGVVSASAGEREKNVIDILPQKGEDATGIRQVGTAEMGDAIAERI